MNGKSSIIIANWKMKMNLDETVDLTKEIVGGMNELKAGILPEIVLCPSYIAMSEVRKILESSEVRMGSQDVFWEENGAYTGEVSVEMLKDLGCRYFIVGHSERRQYLGETNEMVNKKVKAVLRAGLTPIVCVGETREERQERKKEHIVTRQVEGALRDVRLVGGEEIIVAYEPVWVIGTGQAVEPEETKYMSDLIRRVCLDFCDEENLRAIYGGSADSENIEGFIEKGGVDGFLVGTASLDVGEFLRMVSLMSDVD